MQPRSFLCLLLAANASVWAVDVAATNRIGVRVGPNELTPVLGVGLRTRYLTSFVDGWIQPFRFKDVTPGTYRGQPADIQHLERRFGLTTGVGLDIGSRDFGVVPSAGWELSLGYWSGSTMAPGESVGWLGGMLRFGREVYLGGKYYPEGARAGAWRIELVGEIGRK